MYGTKQITVEHLFIQETGTYNQQYHRPIQSVMDDVSLNELRNLAATSNGKFNANALAKMSTPIIAQGSPESIIQIANGWETRRLRFVLKLSIMDQMDNVRYCFVSGYTDKSDLSMGGLIDPNSIFYINNISYGRVITRRSANGSFGYVRMDSSDQLLSNASYGGLGTSGIYSLRPETVFNTMESYQYSQFDSSFRDTRGIVNKQPMFSSRENQNGVNYLERILNTYVEQNALDQNGEINRVLDSSSSAIADRKFTNDPFISALMSVRRNQHRFYDLSSNNSFTLSELEAIDPMVARKLTLVPLVGNQLHNVGSTENWADTSLTTSAASSLAQGLPGYMSMFSFTTFRFSATNMVFGTDHVVTIEQVGGANNQLDQSANLQAMVSLLKNQLLTTLSFNNTMSYEMTVSCDLYGETWITLSLNSEPPRVYCFPTFGDSLLSSMYTNNIALLNTTASDLHNALENVMDELGSKTTTLFDNGQSATGVLDSNTFNI